MNWALIDYLATDMEVMQARSVCLLYMMDMQKGIEPHKCPFPYDRHDARFYCRLVFPEHGQCPRFKETYKGEDLLCPCHVFPRDFVIARISQYRNKELV